MRDLFALPLPPHEAIEKQFLDGFAPSQHIIFSQLKNDYNFFAYQNMYKVLLKFI